VIFLNSGTSATAGKLNSTIIKGYKKILGKFGEIQREFVDVYSPASDNDCRGLQQLEQADARRPDPERHELRPDRHAMVA
jgi:hypothetical protein